MGAEGSRCGATDNNTFAHRCGRCELNLTKTYWRSKKCKKK